MRGLVYIVLFRAAMTLQTLPLEPLHEIVAECDVRSAARLASMRGHCVLFGRMCPLLHFANLRFLVEVWQTFQIPLVCALLGWTHAIAKRLCWQMLAYALLSGLAL
jgi:hypothetical protein